MSRIRERDEGIRSQEKKLQQIEQYNNKILIHLDRLTVSLDSYIMPCWSENDVDQ